MKDDLGNKIKKLKELQAEYKKKNDTVLRAAKESDAKIVEEEKKIMSQIKEVQEALPSTGIEIEDGEPFFKDPFLKRPGNEERYFLVKTADDAIRVRVYKGDKIKSMRDPVEFSLSILRPLNDRLPKFIDVVYEKAKNALE